MFPFSVGGIIILGLMVSSIRKFAQELGRDKVVKRNMESRRTRTLERSVTLPTECERRNDVETAMAQTGVRPSISAPFDPRKRAIAFSPSTADSPKTPKSPPTPSSRTAWSLRSPLSPLKSPISWASSISDRIAPQRGRKISDSFHKLRRRTSRRTKLIFLREEKDRFDAMREIQYNTRRFKRYFALTMSVIAFGLLWCVGAVVFWQAEQYTQGLTYFQALYFCYVSLLTIGYGDLSPRSNAGKPFFIVWSLIAVPTMTILISDMGDTVVASYKRGTFQLANWTFLPKKGIMHEFLINHPWLNRWVEKKVRRHSEHKRVEAGFPVGPGLDPSADEPGESDVPDPVPTLEQLADDDALDEHDLAHKLTHAVRRTADDLKTGSQRRYSYEEWVEFTRLIRFTTFASDADLDAAEADEGIVQWDWIGEDSPMMADQSECEWVLDRLVESLDRYMRRQMPDHVRQRQRHRQHQHPQQHGAAARKSEEAGSRRRRSASVNQAGAQSGGQGAASHRTASERRGDPEPGWLGAPRPAEAQRHVESMAALRMKQQ